MANQALLEKMKQRIEALIAKWLKDNPILEPNERIIFTLQVIEIPPVVEGSISLPSSEVPTRAREHYTVFDRDLTDQDWKIIFSLPWRGVKLDVLEGLKKAKNQPITVEESPRWMNGYQAHHGQVNQINRELQTKGLPYYIQLLERRTRNNNWWETKLIMRAIK